MISIRCHTNLDFKFCEEWPRELPCRPVQGDIITSKSGLELQVVRITFPRNTGTEEDFLEVELHLVPNRFKNIGEFNEWERKRHEPKIAKETQHE
jgi:hypothetical protein